MPDAPGTSFQVGFGIMKHQRLTVWIAAAVLLVAAQVQAHAADSPAPTPAGPQPRIQVTNPAYDFGTVLEGSPVKHEFSVKNARAGRPGDWPGAKFMRMHGGAVPDKKRLAPGEQTLLPVTFDTRHEKGPATRRIDVYTNDPQTPDLVLTIQGTVRTESEATPSEVLFDSVRRGSEQTRDVAISYHGTAKDFSITKVANSNPNIAVTQQPGPKLKVGPEEDDARRTVSGHD